MLSHHLSQLLFHRSLELVHVNKPIRIRVHIVEILLKLSRSGTNRLFQALFDPWQKIHRLGER